MTRLLLSVVLAAAGLAAFWFGWTAPFEEMWAGWLIGLGLALLYLAGRIWKTPTEVG